ERVRTLRIATPPTRTSKGPSSRMDRGTRSIGSVSPWSVSPQSRLIPPRGRTKIPTKQMPAGGNIVRLDTIFLPPWKRCWKRGHAYTPLDSKGDQVMGETPGGNGAAIGRLRQQLQGLIDADLILPEDGQWLMATLDGGLGGLTGAND